MQNERQMLIKELAKECNSVEDVHEKLRDLFKDTLQEIFEAEIDEHLGYTKHDNAGDNSGNNRNGYSKKTVKSRFGESEIQIPRNRNGTFEPKIVKKYETTSNQLEEQIIAMYAKGMSTRDIEDHMRDIYGIDVSATTVSKVTDKILPLIAEWQSRPLDRVYPIVFLDAIHFKVRKDNRILIFVLQKSFQVLRPCEYLNHLLSLSGVFFQLLPCFKSYYIGRIWLLGQNQHYVGKAQMWRNQRTDQISSKDFL